MTEKVTERSRHLTASMVVIDPGTERVLLVLHNATGKWVFPGGHIDAGETPCEAAVREVREETGITATPINVQTVPLPGMTWHPSPWITAEIAAPAKPERPGKPAEPAHRHVDMLFIGTADSQLSLEGPEDEVASVDWMHLSHLSGLDFRAEVPALARAAYNLAMTQVLT